MKKAVLILSVFIIQCSLTTLLPGCASVSSMPNKDKEISNSALLEPQASLKFTDLPVPVGFRFMPSDSYSFESAGLRVGLLKYQGKANPDQVVNFYKEQMPMYNWSLLNSIEYGQRLLNFEREQESCIITMLPKGGGTMLVISLGPKSQQMLKKEENPVK